MCIQKRLAFGLSTILHLGLLYVLGLIVVKPAVNTAILEINLAPWHPSARSSIGKHPLQHTLIKKSENSAQRKIPAIHQTTPTKLQRTAPKHQLNRTVSRLHLEKSSAPVKDNSEKISPPHAVSGNGPPVGTTTVGDPPSQSYFASILARIEEEKHYPPSAARRHIEGSAVVTFHLASNGRLLFIRLKKSSGYHMLDQAALAAVQNAAPFPADPDETESLPRLLSVTISFVLTR